jgi:hypothetical protein
MRLWNVKPRATLVPTYQSVMPLVVESARVSGVRVPGTWAQMNDQYLYYAERQTVRVCLFALLVLIRGGDVRSDHPPRLTVQQYRY